MTKDTQVPEEQNFLEAAVDEVAAPKAAAELNPEFELEPGVAMIPANLPRKFVDLGTGAPRWKALVNSYIALERRLAQLSGPPQTEEERDRLQRLLGKPESPQEYAVDLPHGLLTVDPDVNIRLHKCGCTQEQVQEVYNLAAEKFSEALQQLAQEVQADREVERLVAYFGGADKWAEVARQLLAFGQNTLPSHVLDNLASSFEGVLALHRMMTAGVPAIPGAREAQAGPTALVAEKKTLDAMLHDRRYWKDKDPAFIAEVTDGFRRLYGER